jgi:hypothetical protein
MKLLTNGSDSVAGDFLKLGTKFRDRYCPDNRPDRVIIMHALAYLRDRAIATDGMPKEAYLHWMHEVAYNYDTIINDEECDDTTADTTTITNAHKPPLIASLKKLGRQFIITTTDKATGCYALICKRWYMNTIRSKLSTNTYTVCQDNSNTICADITEQLLIWNIKIDLVLNEETNKYTDIPTTLPTYFLTLKAHKIPQSVRGVASVSGTPIAALARLISKAQQLCIQTKDEIWRKLALLCKVACNGSWVITDI